MQTSRQSAPPRRYWPPAAIGTGTSMEQARFEALIPGYRSAGNLDTPQVDCCQALDAPDCVPSGGCTSFEFGNEVLITSAIAHTMRDGFVP